MNGRFPVLDAPQALPGQCFLDRQTTGPFVDLGWSFDDYGAVYLCRACVAEIAGSFGFLTPERAAGLTGRVRDLEEQAVALRARLAGLATVAEALSRWREIQAATTGVLGEEGDGGVPAGDAGHGDGDDGGGRRGRAGGRAADGAGGGKVRAAAGAAER